MQLFKVSYIKYIIAIVVFGVIMLFFDQNDIFTQKKRMEDLKESKENIEFLKKEIATMAQELDEVKTDNKKIEQYARERYVYKKDNEDLFLIIDDTVKVAPKK